MTTNDDFIPSDYLLLSLDIENSIKSNTPIQIQKNAAWQRCAVSRAYYSAFLSIRSEFKKDPHLQSILRKEGKDHQIVIDQLFKLRGKMKSYANNLYNLRKNRQRCDYNLPPDFSISMAKVEKANKDAQTLITNSQYIVNNIPKN